MFNFLATEAEAAAQDSAAQIVSEAKVIAKKNQWSSKYPMLVAGLESADSREQHVAAYTAHLMANQARFVQAAARKYGESTVVANLGEIAPRIMDVVRVFAPSTIAHIIATAQPLSQLNGQVIVIQPKFSNTAAGVTRGDQVFKSQTNGTYAAEYNSDAVGTGDGATTNFTTTLFRVRPGQLTITVAGTTRATDDGAGVVSGGTGGTAVTGTINYDTGELDITFTTAPTLGQAIVAVYYANTEQDADAIRELELGLNIIPVTAQSHPLRMTWSTQAELAASASIGLDVEDTLSVVAGQFLRVERDRQIINYIATLAGAVDSDLTFSAALPVTGGVTRRQHFNDISITISYAENKIFAASGRGSVSWVVAGTQAAVVFKSMSEFVAEPNVVPIGAHLIGKVGDVAIIKDPSLTATDFLCGYNGILPGDSGVIVADWIPVYFTPTFQSPDLRGSKALLSMYDIVTNVGTYYKRGQVTSL